MKRYLPFILLAAAAGAGPAAAQDVTFSKDVAPILWKSCVSCHRPGDVGPFTLLNYKDAAKRARHLKEITASRRMPPWQPEPGWGDFHNPHRLSAAEIALIGRWADSGAKEGDAADLPALPQFTEGWRLGKPDAVFKMAQPFAVPATGADIYRCFVIPTTFTEDHWVSGFEFRAGNRKVVHHSACMVDTAGAARKLDGEDGKPGYNSFGTARVRVSGRLGGWAPGRAPYMLPEGTGFKLPKGADLVLQIHYHPDGKPEIDQSSLALYFAKKPVERLVVAMLMTGGPPIDIPAGAKRYRLEDKVILPVNTQVIGISPHMHLLGREMKVTATLPDGTVKPMVWIKDWDFNWQGIYTYRELVALPKGTRLEMEAFYDNSADNPQNPNSPPKRVRNGPNSTDEMCQCTLVLVPEERTGYPALNKWFAARVAARRAKIKMLQTVSAPAVEPVDASALLKRVDDLERRHEEMDRKIDVLLRKLGVPDTGPPPGAPK